MGNPQRCHQHSGGCNCGCWQPFAKGGNIYFLIFFYLKFHKHTIASATLPVFQPCQHLLSTLHLVYFQKQNNMFVLKTNIIYNIYIVVIKNSNYVHEIRSIDTTFLCIKS